MLIPFEEQVDTIQVRHNQPLHDSSREMAGLEAHRAQAATSPQTGSSMSAPSAPSVGRLGQVSRRANHYHQPHSNHITSATRTTTRTKAKQSGSRLAEGVSLLAICISLSALLLLSPIIRPTSGFESIQAQLTANGAANASLQPAPSHDATSKHLETRNNASSFVNTSTFSEANLSPFSVASMAFNSSQTTQQDDPNNQAQSSDDDSLIIGVEIANSIIFVIGLCGNTIVILVILKFTKIETVTDIYILNLAFADLMFIMGLLFLVTTMHIDHWIFGNLMCKLYMASTSLNQFASSLLLVVMSFDRFLAVCHPIYAQRFRRPRRAKIICLAIWVACLILMTPIFVFAKTNKALTCAIFWPEYESFNCEMVFTFSSFAIGFFVPLLLIGAFYLQVLRKLRVAATGQINLGSSRRSRTRETTNKRVEHLVIGIIFTYTMCWLPYWITQMYVSVSMLQHSPFDGFYPFYLVATSLSYTNSALNPILYAFLSDNFKRRCSEIGRSISSIKWWRPFELAGQSHSYSQSNHATVVTSCYEHSEAPNSALESRQQVPLNESIRFINSSPRRLTKINARSSAWHQASKRQTVSIDDEDQQEGGQSGGLGLVVKSTMGPTCGQDGNKNCNHEQYSDHSLEVNKSNHEHEESNANGELDTNQNNGNLQEASALIGGQIKKSVNFSVDTVVVQDLNNNKNKNETLKGNHHTIIPIDSNNNNNDNN